MQYLEKFESKFDCVHITFLKLDEFKQLIAQKKEFDTLSETMKRSRSIH
jgi:glutaredoxin-related protein